MAYIGDNAVEIEPVDADGGIASLARLVLAELPQCDDLTIRLQLAYALREFCRETNACTCESVFDAKDGRPDHCDGSVAFPLVGAPSGMVVGSVLSVDVNGRSAAFDVEDAPVARVRVRTWISRGDKVRIRFSVYPKAGGEDCPKWFKERYAEAIVAGAMHHLLSMNRAWHDAQRAAEYGAKYTDAIAEASYRSTGSAMQGGPESAIPCGGLFM